MAFHKAKKLAYELGLPIVSITPHTAMCVVHYIEELEEMLHANEHTIKTWMDKVGVLDSELSAQQRRAKLLKLNMDVLHNALKEEYRKIDELERRRDNDTAEYLEMQERMS